MGCREPIPWPIPSHPPGLVYCSLGNRTGLTRNPRAGEFQGKGKNSTCLVSLGKEEGLGKEGAQGCTPHFGEHPLAPLHRQQSSL